MEMLDIIVIDIYTPTMLIRLFKTHLNKSYSKVVPIGIYLPELSERENAIYFEVSFKIHN
jgi:hypothetical protein